MEDAMDVLTYSDARAQLKSVMDRVIDDHDEIIVTRRNGGSVMVVSLETWNAVTETLHLLSTPKNAARLRDAIGELDGAGGRERDLVD
jgi:antitoxin YefM